MRNLVLIGHKGVGKSFLGSYLARALSLDFKDTDNEIEKKFQTTTGLSFSCQQIYSHYGEVFFRELERKTLDSLGPCNNCIIATGAGALLCPKNLMNIQKFPLLLLCKDKNTLKNLAKNQNIAYLDKDRFENSFENAFKKREAVFSSLCVPSFFIGSSFSFSQFLEFVRMTYGF